MMKTNVTALVLAGILSASAGAAFAQLGQRAGRQGRHAAFDPDGRRFHHRCQWQCVAARFGEWRKWRRCQR